MAIPVLATRTQTYHDKICSNEHVAVRVTEDSTSVARRICHVSHISALELGSRRPQGRISCDSQLGQLLDTYVW